MAKQDEKFKLKVERRYSAGGIGIGFRYVVSRTADSRFHFNASPNARTPALFRRHRGSGHYSI
ncbi:hypothetical protein, partial [Paraburkholderia sp. J7]|uniref:hypothetical protein n=1 Tax=Paraburkholderia sp. J7 TaxID=2805438 RepID=UPI002AB6ADB9